MSCFSTNKPLRVTETSCICFQINIDCKTRATITKNISEPDAAIFEMAQALIYRLMTRDSYPRFLKSDIYQALLQNWGHTLTSLGMKCLFFYSVFGSQVNARTCPFQTEPQSSHGVLPLKKKAALNRPVGTEELQVLYCRLEWLTQHASIPHLSLNNNKKLPQTIILET